MNAILTTDITVNTGVLNANGELNSGSFRGWTPIGSETHPYTDTFDGQGHIISGLYFKDTSTSFVGLFGFVGENGSVSNVGVVDSYFSGNEFVGGVCGLNYGGIITNCYHTGTVSGAVPIGGVCGINYGGVITNCYHAGTVSGTDRVGGVCGINGNGMIENCYNTGTITATNQYAYVGGVCGINENGTIQNCYNTGTVTATNQYAYVGGVCGGNRNGMITRCNNAGVVTVTSEIAAVGGVCGVNENGTITHCYNAGTVSGTSYAGGVCGGNIGTITSCYNTGVVTATGESGSAGGVCGVQIGGTITNCYYLADEDSEDGGTTIDRFASGEVCYLLNGSTSIGPIWYQNIDNGTADTYPVFDSTHGIVYLSPCTGLYSNTNTGHTVSGEYDSNGFGSCSVCNAVLYQPATQNESGVYEIYNPGQLYWFAEQVNSGNTSINAVLMEDIVVNQTVLNENGELNEGSFQAWTTIGWYDNASDKGYSYTGTFDGQGHTVSGLYFNNGSVFCVGLFGYVGNGGNVSDVSVVDSYFNGGTYVGGVCGYNWGGTITNCYYTGTVSGTENNIGGVCGYNWGGTITNCYNKGLVSGTNYVGGVCGYNSYGAIENCDNTGTVNGSDDVGGVCGDNSGTITNCYNAGKVSGADFVGGVCGYDNYGTITYCYNEGEVSGNNWVGGVCGEKKGDTIANCHNEGIISGTENDIGGVCGENSGTITNCHNTGSVSGTATGSSAGIYVGGVCGYNNGTITNCYNEGTVTASNQYAYTGGVCGYNWGGTVENSHNEGTVNGTSDVGGVCGYNDDGTIENCYNEGTVNGFGDTGGVCGGNCDGAMKNCYNTGTITASDSFVYVGGVCGGNYRGTIENCHNIGRVTATQESPHIGGVCGYSSGTITNCYYLEGTATGGIDGADDTTNNVVSKTEALFHSGEVAYLLAQGENGSVWGQKMGTDSYPVLDSTKKVYQIMIYPGCEGNPGVPTDGYANAEGPVYAEHLDSNGDGICDTCDNLLPVVKKVSATLNGDIGLNYYIVLPESVTADAGAYVQFTVNGLNTKVYVKDVTAQEDGTYKFTCWLTAKEMRDAVTFKLYDGNGTLVDIYKNSGEIIAGASFDYTLETYFKKLSEDAALKELADATLAYGAYAQIVFDHNADFTWDGSDLTDVTVDTLEKYKITKSAEIPEGLKLTEMTLILETETTIRLYFKSDNIRNYTFKLDGAGVVLNEITEEGLYYVEIANISAKDLDTMHTLEINENCTLTFNAFSYAYATVKADTNEAICNVVKALYKYNEAANAYFVD